MNPKLYLAIYDEQKLISDFIHNNLERIHQYQVLFSVSSEIKLFKSLTQEVKLLLLHAPDTSNHLIEIARKVLVEFKGIKILIYSPEAETIRSIINTYAGRVMIVSMLNGAEDFFEAIGKLLPEHHKEEKRERREYNLGGFEKIKQNRKCVLILKMVEDGMKPKEMTLLTGLKHETINSYIEQMVKETGCGNISEVLMQARRRNIL